MLTLQMVEVLKTPLQRVKARWAHWNGCSHEGGYWLTVNQRPTTNFGEKHIMFKCTELWPKMFSNLSSTDWPTYSPVHNQSECSNLLSIQFCHTLIELYCEDTYHLKSMQDIFCDLMSFSCPGSSIHTLVAVVLVVTDCHFRIQTQRVNFETWDPIHQSEV